MGSAPLTCRQPSVRPPFAEVSPKREDLTQWVPYWAYLNRLPKESEFPLRLAPTVRQPDPARQRSLDVIGPTVSVASHCPRSAGPRHVDRRARAACPSQSVIACDRAADGVPLPGASCTTPTADGPGHQTSDDRWSSPRYRRQPIILNDVSRIAIDGAESLAVTETTSCPFRLLAALPEHFRDLVVSNNRHLDEAIKRRAHRDGWDVQQGEHNEVRAGWIAVGYMMQRALPLGPLANVTARYVPRSKIHHRDCYVLRNPLVTSAALGDIAHRPYCSLCDGPGLDLDDDHFDYLWAVMAVDEVTDEVRYKLHRSPSSSEPDTLESWRESRQAEIDSCCQVIATVAAVASVDPRISQLADDIAARFRYQIATIEKRVSAGPGADELPPEDVMAAGSSAIRSWRAAKLPVSGKENFLVDLAELLKADPVQGQASRLIDTPRTRARVVQPSYITGITIQRVEFAHVLTASGRVRSDPALAHPVWGASYEWMAAKLVEKHPASAGHSLIWGIVTNSIARQACDSSCGNGLPICDQYHPYPGHACLHVQVPEKRALVSDWAGWDLLVNGGYIPTDEDDSRTFGQRLIDRFEGNVPAPPDWPDDLLEIARESWIRCLRVIRDSFSRPQAGTQFVVSELRASDVIDIVEGPPLANADGWWGHYLADNPDDAERRERSTATLDELRQISRSNIIR